MCFCGTAQTSGYVDVVTWHRVIHARLAFEGFNKTGEGVVEIYADDYGNGVVDLWSDALSSLTVLLIWVGSVFAIAGTRKLAYKFLVC